MFFRPVLTLIFVSFCSLALAESNAPDCSDLAGWNAGRLGQEKQTRCTESGYSEAHTLGAALADLQSQFDAIEKQLTPEPDNAGVLRRKQRQLAIDIEALHGVATVRHWPVTSNKEEAQ